MDCKQLIVIASKYDWNKIKTKNPYLMSWIKMINSKRTRINLYYTTGTVGISIRGQKEKFLKQQKLDQIALLFENDAYANEGCNN